MKTLFAVPKSPHELLYRRYASRIAVNPILSRSLVSYQSNRGRARYRWFKYKEGFSASLVEYLLSTLQIDSGTLLDPFAGSGVALFVAREHGLRSLGVELLPIGLKVIEARLAAEKVRKSDFKKAVDRLAAGEWRVRPDPDLRLSHLRITEGAFSEATEDSIARFRTYLRDQVRNSAIRQILELTCLSVLESVSFTRKDGQYLRWDSRAPRKLPGKAFDKGAILDFESAILRRSREICDDLEDATLFSETPHSDAGEPVIHQGSCLEVLPTIRKGTVSAIVTSPPYCNRYDYTRTYALELAYLGVDEQTLKTLRQSLLSCTVENKSKVDELRRSYAGAGRGAAFEAAFETFNGLEALHDILAILDQKASRGELNNPNIVRMVKNYFLESTLTIFEWARLVKSGGSVVVVNDNVRYGGHEIPVDLFLCSIAESAGFSVENIWTLARGKGNSSQQTGEHGRSELRKCVYVWRKS